MHFVPIPTTHETLRETAHLWMPFVRKLAEHNREPLGGLLSRIKGGQVQIGLIWDGERAFALLGWIYKPVGEELIAELHWATGSGVKRWRHLLPEYEKYQREHVGVTVSRPIVPRSWLPHLERHGYKVSHYVMEKAL